jgi:hypothetical protein
LLHPSKLRRTSGGHSVDMVVILIVLGPPADVRRKGFKQGRSVGDNHVWSRSARTASAGGTEGDVFVRLRKRARNSSIVGRSAT